MEDNYSMWLHHERAQETWLAKRPVCDCCDEHIQDDHYFDINGSFVCPDCMNDHFRKEID